MTHKDFTTGSTAAVCGGITSVVDMPNTVPPTADAEQVKVKQQLGKPKSLVDFGVTGVVVKPTRKTFCRWPRPAPSASRSSLEKPSATCPSPTMACAWRPSITSPSRSCRWESTQRTARSWPTVPTNLKPRVKTMPGTGSFAPGYLRGRVRAPLLLRDLRHQASRFPHELQAGGLHGARCQSARA